MSTKPHLVTWSFGFLFHFFKPIFSFLKFVYLKLKMTMPNILLNFLPTEMLNLMALWSLFPISDPYLYHIPSSWHYSLAHAFIQFEIIPDYNVLTVGCLSFWFPPASQNALPCSGLEDDSTLPVLNYFSALEFPPRLILCRGLINLSFFLDCGILCPSLIYPACSSMSSL